MVHDFSETILANAVNFKHKTFILNNRSNEFMRENDCQTKHSKLEREAGKQAFDSFLSRCGTVLTGRAELKQLTIARVSSFSFLSFDCFL